MIWEPSPNSSGKPTSGASCSAWDFTIASAFLQFSREEPERFWDEIMREMGVEWFEPYHQTLDASRGPEWAQWFVGGKLNIAHNCLDRWADSGRVACIWEGESGETRAVTFAELREDANRVANGLTALGLEPGDRVALCDAHGPEILAILYGCFKAGLTVVPIFAGFGSGAIATRLEDSGARVLFTATHLERRGKALPLLEKMPPAVEHIIVLPYRGGDVAGHLAGKISSPLNRPLAPPPRSIPKRARSSCTPPAPPASPRARSTPTPDAWRRWVRKSGWVSTIARTTASSGSPTSDG
jgi:acetyl-CoA synthetase